MLGDKKVIVVMPAYNAEKTLKQTAAEIPYDLVDEAILVDDCSRDNTVVLAHKLGLTVVEHKHNRGYGGNQKTCYQTALEHGADIVVMLHPDYQYSPRLLRAMICMLESGHYDIVLASRMLGNTALKGGMPFYKYIANRFLTCVQNRLMGVRLSEYHTGYRGWTRNVLEKLPLEACSDDFVFDNQMLSLALKAGFRAGEISCPTRYFDEASSINLKRSIVYGLGCLKTAFHFRLHSMKIPFCGLFRK